MYSVGVWGCPLFSGGGLHKVAGACRHRGPVQNIWLFCSPENTAEKNWILLRSACPPVRRPGEAILQGVARSCAVHRDAGGLLQGTASPHQGGPHLRHHAALLRPSRHKPECHAARR